MPVRPGSSGVAANAAKAVPSADSSTRSSCETAAPRMTGIGGTESSSKHMPGPYPAVSRNRSTMHRLLLRLGFPPERGVCHGELLVQVVVGRRRLRDAPLELKRRLHRPVEREQRLGDRVARDRDLGGLVRLALPRGERTLEGVERAPRARRPRSTPSRGC